MVDEPFCGEAIFGTINGLTVAGNGQLETLSRSLSLVEFRSLVREAPNGVKIGFKRSIVTHDGIKLDLLGAFISAKDHVGRDGLIGGSVAVKHADFNSCQKAFRRSVSLLDGVLENSWDWGVEKIEQGLPRRAWGELKGKELRDADEASDVIILKESPEIQLDAVDLFSLGASQVGSLRHYADSLIVVYATPEVTADPVDFTLLEYCRSEQAKALAELRNEVDELHRSLEQSTAQRLELDKQCRELESWIGVLEKERVLSESAEEPPVNDGSAIDWSQIRHPSESSGPMRQGSRQLSSQPQYRGKTGSTIAGERQRSRVSYRHSYNEDDRQRSRFSRFFKRLMSRRGRPRGYRQRGILLGLLTKRVGKVLISIVILMLTAFVIVRAVTWVVSKIFSAS